MSDSFLRHQTAADANNAKEERICEISRRISEIDALLRKYKDASAKHPGTVSEGEMLYWVDRHQERNMLLAEHYRLTKKTA